MLDVIVVVEWMWIGNGVESLVYNWSNYVSGKWDN